MCIQPRAGALVPEMTARVARACNPRGTVAMTIRDRLEGLWSDEDFAEWYPRDGRPGFSPAQLAIASVLQFLLELSDRQAAEAVRCRIDFKYALGLELEDPGFHHSLLGDFRDRLAEDGRADELFSLALERIKTAGLVKERGRARTDSTHVLAAVRDLTRLELMVEAVRAALEEIAQADMFALRECMLPEWGPRYGRSARLGKNPSAPKTRIKQVGDDAYVLLNLVARLPSLRHVSTGQQVQALKLIYEQNYYEDAAGRRQWRTGPSDGLPAPADRIVSPYDLTARYARRGSTRWTGFLAHVTETCDDGTVNIITDVATTSATSHDSRELPAIHQRLARRELLPVQHLVDGGYTSVQLRADAAREHRIELIGPLHPAPPRKPRDAALFDRTAFTIDWKKQTVTCPDGKRAARWATPRTNAPYVVATFTPRQCGPCPLKDRCTRGKNRSLTFMPRDLGEIQDKGRAQQQTPEWKQRYALRSGAESTISEFVQGHGMRRTRYRDQDKAHVGHVMTAIAVNAERIHALDEADEPPEPRKPTSLQRYIDWQHYRRPRSWSTP